MGKSAILRKIYNAAKNYQIYLAGKTFMYIYEGKNIEVVFKNSLFLHLTGVNTKLRAKESYKHAKTKNGLKVQEFFFDKNHPYDLAEKKEWKQELREMFDLLIKYMYKNLNDFGTILAADGKAIQNFATKISKNSYTNNRYTKSLERRRNQTV